MAWESACDCCAVFVQRRFRAPETAWPVTWVCEQCADELASEAEMLPDEPECDCRDYCQACCPV